MDGGSWTATVHGVTKGQARLSTEHTYIQHSLVLSTMASGQGCQEVGNMCPPPAMMKDETGTYVGPHHHGEEHRRDQAFWEERQFN